MNLARRMQLGRLLYLVWHRPLAGFARSCREGGPLNQFMNWRGSVAMEHAAAQLPSRPNPEANAPEVCFLTGRRFWYQTAFCCWSLCRASGRELAPVFIDDGTIDDALQAECIRLFPGARVLDAREIQARLDEHLP